MPSAIYRLSWRTADGSDRQAILQPGENVLGSAADCDVVLEGDTISRHHAVLVLTRSGIELADLGSANGTWYQDRQRPDRSRQDRRVRGPQLLEAAEIRLGSLELRLDQIADGDTTPATLPFFEPIDSKTSTPGRAETTASLAPLDAFIRGPLPDLVDRLAAGAPRLEAAQWVAQTLEKHLPLAINVDSSRGAILFASATELETELEAEHEIEHEIEARGSVVERIKHPGFTLEARFLSPRDAAFYRPLIVLGAGLIAMATRVEGTALENIHGERPAASLPSPPSIDGHVQRLYDKARTVADGEIHVLIRGASGTGKEVMARFIHRASRRAERPFIALNCAALPRDLQEVELFGIESGVATGVDSRPGRFEEADRGTLFLDEIGDMALEVQAKILRVLQEGEVYRIGGRTPRPARVRVLSATHQDLDAMRRAGSFRDDLYHRISDWVVTLPTLAERRADLPNLAAYFAAAEAKRIDKSIAGISRAALVLLTRQEWPGNVRQLQRAMARSVLFANDGGLVDTRCLEEAEAIPSASDGDAEGASGAGTLKARLEEAEKQAIHGALEAAGGEASLAAEILDVHLSTFYRKMKALGFSAP